MISGGQAGFISDMKLESGCLMIIGPGPKVAHDHSPRYCDDALMRNVDSLVTQTQGVTNIYYIYRNGESVALVCDFFKWYKKL